MKKILLFSSLLLISAGLSAKEIMPAPSPEPEKIVEIVEKPVIVYRDREVKMEAPAPKWKPNGTLTMTYNFYGETENKTVKDDTDKNWISGNENNGRLETILNLNFTEKQTLNVRSRLYHSLRDNESKRAGNPAADNLRLRHFYKFGKLGNSKVEATSRLEYTNSKATSSNKTVERNTVDVSVLFNFKDYFPKSDLIQVKTFGFRPRFRHYWNDHGNDSSYNRYYVNFESYYELPYGFSAELNLYPYYTRNADTRFDVGNSGEKRKGQFGMSMEAYLFYTKSLYKNGKFELAYDFDGGYDTYEFRQFKTIAGMDGKRNDRRAYSLYMGHALSASYKPTDYVRLKAGIVGEYRNWKAKAESEAKRWRWQPRAYAQVRVTF